MHAISAIGTDGATETWWLYLLLCEDGRTYAGITLDVQARFNRHVSGKGAKFTHANHPIAILGTQPFTTKSEALRAEYVLKQLARPARLQWALRHPARG